jgi:hypothetical protein
MNLWLLALWMSDNIVQKIIINSEWYASDSLLKSLQMVEDLLFYAQWWYIYIYTHTQN